MKACQKCFKKPYAQVGSKSVSSQVRTSVTQASLREPLKKRSLAAACCHNMSRLTLAGERPGLVSPLFFFSFACLSQGRVGVGYGMVVREHQSGTLVVVVATY